MATAAQVKAFIEMVGPIFQRQAKKHGNKIFASVGIAQACCESAYGTSKKMVKANALMGFKVGKNKVHFGTAWHDKAYSTKTNECYDGKTYVQITDMFRAYDCIEDSIEDYFDLLCSASRYKGALNQPTPQKCIEGIKAGGYATSPTYINTIMSIVKKYGLTKYDSDSVLEDSKFFKKYVGNTSSIQNALNSIGEESSYSYRKKIAVKNGIIVYKGTAAQNTKMLTLLKAGTLMKP